MLRIFKKRKANKYGKHIFTFPKGERLYQLREEYFEKMPAKKLSYIQENSNYIAFLGVSKATLEAGHRMIKDHAYQITALTEFKDKQRIKDKCSDLVKLVNQIETTREEYDRTNEAIMVSLFDLFFFFEDENLLEWNEQTMERKRYFLNQYPYFKSFFFQKLNDYTSVYKATFQNCINYALIQSNVQEIVKDTIKELSHTDINLFKTN